MYRSYWIAVAALGLTLLASTGLPAQEDGEAEAGQGAEPLAQQATEQILTLPSPLPVEIVIEDGEAEARQAAEQRSEARADSDLAAQQGMNESTQRMSKLALWQTILIAIGTAAIIYTLYLTRQANRAAQDAVVVARDIGQKQVRAYLSLRDCRIDGLEVGKSPTVQFTIINSGQSPAKLISAAVGIQYAPANSLPRIALSPVDRTPRYEGAGGVFYHSISTRRPLNAEESSAIVNGTSTIVAACEIHFEDVFADDHVFRVDVYRRHGAPSHQLSVYSPEN